MLKFFKQSGFAQAAAGGVGLFSDGYLNGVSGSLTTIIGNLYPKEYTTQKKSLLNSMIFMGNVLGMLIFGYACDKSGRKYSLIVASVLLVVFAILSAAAYYKGTNNGVINSLIVYRFLLGIGIGGEYPAGSTTISEGAQEMRGRHKHSLFIFLTDFMICMGFVMAGFCSFVLASIFGESRQEVIWRSLLAIGAICPFILLIVRFRMSEPESYRTYAMKSVRIPYRFVIRVYRKRLFFISLVWFMYNFTSYSFGIYFAPILQSISKDMKLSNIFGWATFIYLFYLPGSFCGAILTDYVEPKNVLAIGVFIQGSIGFIIASFYNSLKNNIPIFVLLYGVFMTFGEFGPGDNIGNISAKAPSTPVRGHFYGIAAACGKLGAFLGSYVFNYVVERFGGPGSESGNRAPFFIGSAVIISSGIISLFFFPKLSQDCVLEENERFKRFLEENGFDTTKMGLIDNHDSKESNEISEKVSSA
ncbi:hypothetical protein PORY_002065 [Pneumocystis oryctolagi]|uniref:Uncharacterized protein n=1 Tax=Pneumocystis oryctolagi TaxID=42067 RepID=A0ACB7CC77_9ASCO|nr:hypothetical protein PORY_002065 [Pneumocystis oryctolagi]